MTVTQPLKVALRLAGQRQIRPRLKSDELFRDSNEVVIDHRGEEYRLRLTRNDKLILNK